MQYWKISNIEMNPSFEHPVLTFIAEEPNGTTHHVFMLADRLLQKAGIGSALLRYEIQGTMNHLAGTDYEVTIDDFFAVVDVAERNSGWISMTSDKLDS